MPAVPVNAFNATPLSIVHPFARLSFFLGDGVASSIYFWRLDGRSAVRVGEFRTGQIFARKRRVMADTLRDYPHSRYVPKTMPTTTPGDDLSPRKTLLVLVVVVGCFAVLWPKLFYPMLVANANQHIKPSSIDKTTGIRQERSSHLRSEMVHPAFRERGRAIPKPEAVRRSATPPRIVEGRPGPIPGLRPTMGGAGHVVPSKQQSAGLMGLLMPIYTIGIVIFFTYTVMKLAFKKKPETYVGVPLYPNTEPDEHFRKEVFESVRDRSNNRFNRDTTNNKLGWKERDTIVNAMSALLDEVDQEIQARRKCAEAIPEQDEIPTKTDDQQSVKVLGMEMTASCEDGKKWSRPVTPVHPVAAPQPSEPLPPPQEIFLEGALPAQSQLLVTDSATETQKSSEEDPAVVLAGKMTLSVIACETAEPVNGNVETGSVEEDKATVSSNGSDSFEKVEAGQLEEQIGDIIQEALNAASEYVPHKDDNEKTEEVRKEEEFNLIEEIEKMNQEIKDGIERETPVGLEMDKIVIEEIKKQLKLEDDLLEALISDERKEVDAKTIEEDENIEMEPTKAAIEDVEHSDVEVNQEEPLKETQEDKNNHEEADLQLSEQHEVVSLSEEIPNTEAEEDLQSAENNTEMLTENENEHAVPEENYDDEPIDEGDYEDEEVDDEIRNVDGTERHHRLSAERMNGDETKHETDGAAVGEEDSVSEEEEGSESDEIEEIIEYVDYTDEEGEEIVEVNERVNENSH